MAEERKTQWRVTPGLQPGPRARQGNQKPKPQWNKPVSTQQKASFKILDLVDVSLTDFLSTTAKITNEAVALEKTISADAKKQQLFQASIDEMRVFVQEVIPGAQVEAFGSISSSLCLQRSGLDLTVLVPEPADHKEIMDTIASHLETKPGKLNYNNKGKYPVARFTNESKLGLCLTVNNYLGIANSEMLKKRC